jgi:hypothetical protein
MPNVLNSTPFVFDVLLMIDQAGRPVGVAVLKATYEFNATGELSVAGEQRPLLLADEYLGDPQSSPLRVPSDFVDFKPASEVLVIRPPGELKDWPPRQRDFHMSAGSIADAGRLDDPWTLGPVRRDQSPRKQFAGTYDANWTQNRMPLLPADFDPRFHLAAPTKQIAEGYLAGDEPVEVTNTYFEGGPPKISFSLPARAVIVSGNVRTRYFAEVARLDTMILWTEAPQLTLVWRLSIPAQQKFEDIRNVYGAMVRLRTAQQLYGQP